MADTVVDSLVVLLKLDPRQYTEEQQKFLRSMTTTRDAAASTARDLESRGSQGALFFDQIASSALKLGAILVGGIGIKDFIQSTTNATAASGRLATNIGISVEQLSLWQNAVRLAGGSADAVGPAFLGLSQALTTIALRGPGSSDLLAVFQALGVSPVDQITGQIKTVTQLLPEIGDAIQKLPPGVGYNLAASLGLTPDLINTLQQYQKYLEAARQTGNTTTHEQVVALTELQQAWENFAEAQEAIGKRILASQAGWMSNLLNLLARSTEQGDLWDRITGKSQEGVLIPIPPAANQNGAAATPGGKISLFNLIQNLEGSGPDDVSSAGAIGRNQITPDTARRYGFDPARLRDPAYNDTVARAIEADLNSRYHGDLDAIALAYHNGPAAADRFLASGRSLAGFGPQTLAYVAKERALTGGGHTAVQIDQITVSTSASSLTGVGNDVGAGIRAALASNSLVSQGNAGPQ